MAARNGKTKAQWVAEEVARAVNAGKPVALETVDFSDPDRPKTCLEVDFPIIPVNQVATIEGNAGKPIYRMSKWWARRRSSIFRSMLIAAAVRAPDDADESAKMVWDAYYRNHQGNDALSKLQVADIFMGGGTTVVEGARLGMNMYGTDLNPVAWFVVKNELANVKRVEVEALLADVEAEVKPQFMPFYACDCPRGHKGKWIRVSTGKVVDDAFDPLALTPEERPDYRYEGPEIIYVFWAKHGPCQVMGCGHRTPVMSSPVIAVKTISVKVWRHKCTSCGERYDLEGKDARMAPGVPLVVAESEEPFAALDGLRVNCPHCGEAQQVNPGARYGKSKKKKIALTLLVHPNWLKGESNRDADGNEYGGSVTDGPEKTAAWNRTRAKHMRLVEVRGPLPDEVICPETGVTFMTGKDGGTVPRKSHYACGACGTIQDVLKTVKASGKSGPVSAYAIQGYCPTCDREKRAYGGRFFIPVTDSSAFDAALREWAERKEGDLASFWPRSELPYGFMTHMQNGGIPNHGFTHWWTMFNPRQLLVHSQLLRAVVTVGAHSWPVREYALGAFQQYLRNQNMFCFWDVVYDNLVPHMSNANYHPKSNLIENSVFPDLGRGNWTSCGETLLAALKWSKDPWDVVSNDRLRQLVPGIADDLKGKSEKVSPSDPVRPQATLECGSATDFSSIADGSYDLVVTDPPFGGLLHYAELADFFYVWLRLSLKDKYPEFFTAEYTPKTLEAVANRAREPEDPNGYYQRLLTAAWHEAHRILKPGGLLAFTFHHNEDAPWVAVLESLFEAGFYLGATYPIRSDEIKGSGEFGSRKIEYDIIHVCRKRRKEPKPVSWAKMRREVLRDVRQLKEILEHHQKAGLPEADIQVIKRGKALEYYSRHYGKVLEADNQPMSVKDALVGINLLLDEETGVIKEPPPSTASALTSQFLRLFDGQNEIAQDQIQKFLRGTGYAPSEFVERGWCTHDKKAKTFQFVSPLDIARTWHGRRRQGMVQDYDQAAFLIGACFDNSGINATGTLANTHFKPHPALGALLDWYSSRGATTEIRNAAIRAEIILRGWKSKNQQKSQQMNLFFEEGVTS